MPRPLSRRPALLFLLAATCGCGRDESSTAPTPVSEPPAYPRDTTPDPRLTADTPFRNVRPGVGYVGDAACQSCHAQITASYHAHPMGRSASVPGPADTLEQYTAAAHHPVETTGYRLEVARAGGTVEHLVAATDPPAAGLPAYHAPIGVAIGSGTRGRSYLTTAGGAVWQSPLSWYTAAGRWDVSPGFDVAAEVRRPVRAECLFCHVNRVEPVPGSVNRFAEPLLREQPAVGCERCHGPGQLHVAERAVGRPAVLPDTSVVNPKHLSAALRQDVCRQCHQLGEFRLPARGREAFDFRPGLALDDFIRVFVRADAASVGTSVGQFEQTDQSQCRTADGGRLTCTACHDPHLSPAPTAKPAFYRAKCQTCHAPPGKDCTAPAADRAAVADSCVQCHMPRGDSANIVHAPVTDHRVQRRPSAGRTDRRLAHVNALVPYGDRLYPDRDRDLGMAMAGAFAKWADGVRPAVGRQAFDRLTAAVGQRPADDAAWLQLVTVSHHLGRSADRLAAARAAARADPPHEQALLQLAEAAALAGETGPAVAAAERLVALSPTSFGNRLVLTKALVMAGDWPRTEAAAREALAVLPLSAEGRLYLAVALARQGRAAESARELAAALALQTDPRVRADYERLYAGLAR